MLKAVSHHHPDQKSRFLSGFDDSRETWVVSDLRSKFEVQNFLLQRQEGFEDISVLRAGELWRLLLRRLRPEIRIAPRDFLMTWLTHQLKKMSREGSDRLLQPQAAKSFLTLMDLLAPVFLSPEGPKRLDEFFSSSPQAADRWRTWSELSFALFQIIRKENWILPGWIPSLLLQEKNLEEAWDRPLWVDLGAGLRQSEVELFKRLSKSNAVTAFTPELRESGGFDFLLQPSRELFSAAVQTEKEPSRGAWSELSCLRLSGPLAEVKQTVAQVREWLEDGVQPHEIAVVAPVIEDYWPLLEPYFELEGIPAAKDGVSRLQSWPSVAAWLARLRLRTGSVSFADVEMGLNADELNLRFEKFRALFRHALELEDLQRGRELESFFKNGHAPSKEIDYEEFMAWAAADWREAEDWNAYEILLKEILQTLPIDVKMDVDAWVSYLESLAVKKEIRVRPGDLSGVALVELASMAGGGFKRRIFLGLTESNFKKNSSALVGAGELNRLGWDFGFFLDHPEQNLLNFELQWALQTPSDEDLLLYPATGFSGSAEAPHPLWLRAGGGHHVHAPPATRWDEIQSGDRALSEKLKRDLGQVEATNLVFAQSPTFSASVIEKYRNCAFQFAAERLFNLLDPPERDLDLDPRSKGNLAHKIFETLTAEPRRWDWTEDELRRKIDELREVLKFQDQGGVFWEVEREKHVRLAQRFLKFEKEWSEQYPQARIEAREKSFEFFFDPKTETFHREMREGFVVLKGTIDRLETNGRFKLVVDYKTRFESKRAFHNWTKSNFLQLGFYAWAVDQGFVEGLSAGEVAGAVTYSYHNLDKRRGLVAPEILGSMMPKADPKEASLETKKKFYEEFETLLKSTLKEALDGKIRPFPLNEDQGICEKCRWSKACRAPHLST